MRWELAPDFLTQTNWRGDEADAAGAARAALQLSDAEKALQELADVFLQQQALLYNANSNSSEKTESRIAAEIPLLNMEAKYRALVEQIPAVVFMAYLDKGIGEAYVSPEIETALG